MNLRASDDKCQKSNCNLLNALRQDGPPDVHPDRMNSVMVVTVDLSSEVGDRQDRLLREANGIVDAIVFPRLLERGVAEADLHSVAMNAVRQVQFGRDHDGKLAELLGVVRCGVNGCRARTNR